jgi:hypothetical protein
VPSLLGAGIEGAGIIGRDDVEPEPVVAGGLI